MDGASGDALWLVDVAALAFIAALAVGGWRSGAIRAVTGIAGFFLALYAAGRFAPALGNLLGTDVSTRTGYGIAFAVLFVLGVLAVRFAGNLLRRVVSLTPLGLVDSLVGAFIQATKGVVLVGVAAVVLALLPIGDKPTSFVRSRVVTLSVTATESLARAIQPHVSGPMAAFIDEAYRYMGRTPEIEIPDAVRDEYDRI